MPWLKLDPTLAVSVCAQSVSSSSRPDATVAKYIAFPLCNGCVWFTPLDDCYIWMRRRSHS